MTNGLFRGMPPFLPERKNGTINVPFWKKKLKKILERGTEPCPYPFWREGTPFSYSPWRFRRLESRTFGAYPGASPRVDWSHFCQALPHSPLMRGSAAGPRWALHSLTPVIGSHSARSPCVSIPLFWPSDATVLIPFPPLQNLKYATVYDWALTGINVIARSLLRICGQYFDILLFYSCGFLRATPYML